jgi:gamma-glutamyltranspeptidase/glutathione hydrolase
MTKKKQVVDTEVIDPQKVVMPEPQRISASVEGMVATAQYRATEVGVCILKQGGNAVDAAVDAAFALGVCEPQASGLGGQTMMRIHLEGAGKTIALDGSSRAPSRAVTELFQTGKPRLYGHTASTVPSTPATLGYALAHYGTMTLPQVLEPAIALALDGYQVTRLQHKLQIRERKALKNRSAGAFFLKDGDRSFPVGSVFRQPVLAKTL